jgi:hypothetical protein
LLQKSTDQQTDVSLAAGSQAQSRRPMLLAASYTR